MLENLIRMRVSFSIDHFICCNKKGQNIGDMIAFIELTRGAISPRTKLQRNTYVYIIQSETDVCDAFHTPLLKFWHPYRCRSYFETRFSHEILKSSTPASQEMLYTICTNYVQNLSQIGETTLVYSHF